MSELDVTVRVPLDDLTHRFLMKAMHNHTLIPWPGLEFKEGSYFVEGISWADGNWWEDVVVRHVRPI